MTTGATSGRVVGSSDETRPKRARHSEGGDIRRLHRQYAKTRDVHLREELVLAYVGLARGLARRFAHRGEVEDDLTQVAFIGLLKALDRFEPERGHAFVAYAVPTIVGEIRRHFRDCRWSLRVPRGLQERYLRVRDVRDTLEQELRHAPSVREVAQYTGLEEDEVVEAMEAREAFHVVSISGLASESPGQGWAALGRVDSELGAAESRQVVRPLLAQLEKREQQIVWMRFFENMTQQEIAQALGMNQMGVCRSLRRSLARMKTLSEAEAQHAGTERVEFR